MRTSLKALAGLALGAVLLLALVGCLSNSDPKPAEPQEKTLGQFCLIDSTDPEFKYFGWDPTVCVDHVLPVHELPIHYLIWEGGAADSLVFHAAAKYWNDVIGKDILIPVDPRNPPEGCSAGECLSLFVDVTDPNDPLADVGAGHKTVAGEGIYAGTTVGHTVIMLDVKQAQEFGRIWMYAGYPELWKVAVHEIGHFLGLVHDHDNPMSAMFPYIINSVPQELTEADLDAIRDLYADQ